MRKCIILALIFCLFQSCSEEPKKPGGPKPVVLAIRAADVSFLPEIEAYPTTFRNSNGEAIDVLDLLKAKGCTAIRIRLWHTPANDHSGFAEVLELSRRVRAKGLKVWVTVHYSDTWADPGKQTKPALWNSLTFANLSDSVYNYTKKIITKINPDIIQIGNEINSGFLWPDGNISDLSKFTTLLKTGIQAVRDVSPTTKVMVHIAGYESATWFYQQLQNQSVDYDMIGLSYYPVWHGKDLNALKSAMNNLGFTFGKELVIAETAYPFTLSWNDWTNNTIGESGQLVPGYPATPDGQKQFLLTLKQLISESQGGVGFCYWAPEWVAYKGTEATNGSSWENMTLFDFSVNALPAMDAFK